VNSGANGCEANSYDGTSTATGSSTNFCSANSAFSGSAWYTSTDCSSGLTKFALAPTGRCDKGSISTCDSGSASLFPTNMPVAGVITYDQTWDSQCQGAFTGATLYNAGCIRTGTTSSESYACAAQTNGTLGTYSQFATKDCTGTATTRKQWTADFDASVVPQYCEVQNTIPEVFTCNFVFGAASTTVVSMVSMIVAVFVALVAKKL